MLLAKNDNEVEALILRNIHCVMKACLARRTFCTCLPVPLNDEYHRLWPLRKDRGITSKPRP